MTAGFREFRLSRRTPERDIEATQGHYFTSLCSAITNALSFANDFPEEIVALELFKPERITLWESYKGIIK